MNAESDLAAPFEKVSLRRVVPLIVALLPAALSLRFLRTVTAGEARGLESRGNRYLSVLMTNHHR